MTWLTINQLLSIRTAALDDAALADSPPARGRRLRATLRRMLSACTRACDEIGHESSGPQRGGEPREASRQGSTPRAAGA
ncbi:MAG: hypothetical protein HRF50_15250 [Phycisphaerae bacterium]|jgi:hypothetical protein